MKRTQRIIAIFELLEMAGGRGLTRDELLGRLGERGHFVEIRQLERDLNDMRNKLDLPIASSDDVTDEQAAQGAKVVYFVNRRALDRKSLLTSGQAIAWLESAGCGVWGPAVEEGLVMLHHERRTSTDQLVRGFASRYPASRILYLGQHCFIHFYLEVSPQLGFDLDVRIGRLTAPGQKPSQPVAAHEILVGFCGFAGMSRLFGPQGGHVAFRFHQGANDVVAIDLGGQEQFGVARVAPQDSGECPHYDRTPVLTAPKPAARSVIRRSGQVSFGGAVAFVWIPATASVAKVAHG